MEPLISVIVPIYKVEEYLSRCVDSIINQTYKNLEIILVDDGSPDDCPKICDDYAKKDNRIKVLHLENGGAGYARNKGLSIASGDFISFIDGDDYIALEMYETFLLFIKDDIDIIECNIINTTNDFVEFEKFDPSKSKIINCNSEKALKYHIEDSIFRQTPPNKLYRMEIVGNIFFPEGKLIDDEFWTYKVLGKANRLVHIDCSMYAYRQQNGSVMHKRYSLKRLQAIDAKCQRLEYIENNYSELTSFAKDNLLFSILFQGQMCSKYLEKFEQKESFDYLTKKIKIYISFCDVMKFSSAKRKIWGTVTLISLKFTCKIRNALKIGF